jgi:hypothetical protein
MTLVLFCDASTGDRTTLDLRRLMDHVPRVGEIVWFADDKEPAHYEVEEVGHAITSAKPGPEPYAVVYVRLIARYARPSDPGWLNEKEWAARISDERGEGEHL